MHRVQAGTVQTLHLARACAKDRGSCNLSARHRAMHRRKRLAQGFRGVESWDESLGAFISCSFLRISAFKPKHRFGHCRCGAGLCAEPLLGSVDSSFLPWVSRNHSVQPGVLPARRVMELRTCSLPGIHRPLGAGAPGGFHPGPAARHQRRRCHLPLGFHGSACGEVAPSPVSAALPPLPPLLSVPSRCNAGLVAFPGLVPPSLLRCQEQVSEFAPSRQLLWAAALPELLFMARGWGWAVDFWFLPSGG